MTPDNINVWHTYDIGCHKLITVQSWSQVLTDDNLNIVHNYHRSIVKRTMEVKYPNYAVNNVVRPSIQMFVIIIG